MRRFSLSLLALSAILMWPQLSRAASTSLFLNFANVTDPVSDGFVALYTSGNAFGGAAQLAPIPVGDSSQSIIISPAALSQTSPANLNDTTPITAIAIIAEYNASSDAPGVTFGVNPSTASGWIGETYAQAFPDAAVTESNIVETLPAITPDLFQSVVIANVVPESNTYPITVGDSGDLVNFSTGTISGSFTESVGPTVVSSVPLPSAVWTSLSTLALLGAGFYMRNRRQARIA